jgi:hypothetical protein
LSCSSLVQLRLYRINRKSQQWYVNFLSACHRKGGDPAGLQVKPRGEGGVDTRNSVARKLSSDQAETIQRWIANRRTVDAVLKEMTATTERALELLLAHPPESE